MLFLLIASSATMLMAFAPSYVCLLLLCALAGLGAQGAVLAVVGVLPEVEEREARQQSKQGAQRAEDVPRVFTRIHVHFIVTGKSLSDERVKRAVQLSAEKYCSASIMLGKAVEITHDYEIVEQA